MTTTPGKDVILEIDLDKEFPITSVSRHDLLDIGFSYVQVASLDDRSMARLASKMADDYCNQMFWGSLEILAEFLLQENGIDSSHQGQVTHEEGEGEDE